MNRRIFFTTLWQNLLKPALRVSVLLLIIYACVNSDLASTLSNVKSFAQACLNIFIYILPALGFVFTGVIVLLFIWLQVKRRLPALIVAFLHKYSKVIYSVFIVAGWVLCYTYARNNIAVISFIILLSLYETWMLKPTIKQ